MKFTTLFLSIIFFSFTNLFSSTHSVEIDTFYGPVEIHEAVLIDLINSPGFQRLKEIHQYGVAKYAKNIEHYTRYDHSLGVFAILRKFNASLEEQIAGLLHDVSHTVFSHVGDFVFEGQGEDAYQDDIHSWYLLKSGIATILNNHGIEWEKALHKHNSYPMLEQDLPNMCADRIEYNIQGGVRHGLISYQEGKEILNNLEFAEGNWYFSNPELADKFACLSIYMTENIWGSAWNLLTYQWAADAIKQALSIQLISFDDVHFSTDEKVWESLCTSKDAIIKEAITKLLKHEEHFQISDSNSLYDVIIYGKYRGINPLVKTQNTLVPLSEINPSFSEYYNKKKSFMCQGWPVIFKTTSKERKAA